MKPIIITAQPDDQYFIWQNHLYIESCLGQGFTEDQIHILLYKPLGRQLNTNWDKLKEYYPNINIFIQKVKEADFIILSVKPQDAKETILEIKNYLNKKEQEKIEQDPKTELKRTHRKPAIQSVLPIGF